MYETEECEWTQEVVKMENHKNVMIVRDNETVVSQGYYLTPGNVKKSLLFSPTEQKYAKVYLPEDIYRIQMEKKQALLQLMHSNADCVIDVCNMDSYECALWQLTNRAVVLNFANAMHPGGGYLCGSRAQEESLCRQSTLYQSLTSKAAKSYYQHNNEYSWLTDESLIISPNVEVFRDSELNLIEEPFATSVITCAAINMMKNDGRTSPAIIDAVMKQKIRAIFLAAYDMGYKYLILGAWGCGAFAHDPLCVAQYFKDILLSEHYYKLFTGVSFAIIDHLKTKSNLSAFEETFCGYESFHAMEEATRN